MNVAEGMVLNALISATVVWVLSKWIAFTERRRCADAAIVEPVPGWWQKELIHARARREADKIKG
jgi:hypothetical protein